MKRGVVFVYKQKTLFPCALIDVSFLQFNNNLNTCTIFTELAINISTIKNLDKNYIDNKIISCDKYESSFYSYVKDFIHE